MAGSWPRAGDKSLVRHTQVVGLRRDLPLATSAPASLNRLIVADESKVRKQTVGRP